MNKALLISIVIMVLLSVIITIGQIWGPVMAWDIYIKMVVTLGILVTLAAFLLVVKTDLGDHKRLKDENYLD